MPPFAEWLTRVLEAGESIQAGPPTVPAADRDRVDGLLRAAFRTHSLGVGGPRLEYDAEIGFAAALTLAEVCWHLVAGSPDEALPMGRLAARTSASADLSADLTLRLLPAAYGRARSRRTDDPLAGWIERLLCRWPLSGVLAGVRGRPDADLGFHGHAGLRLLYAERLADHPRAAWVPSDGPTRELVDHVFEQRGRHVPKPPPPSEVAP